MKPILISLFDYSGTWSQPYREAGWEIIQIDLKLGENIMIWNYKAIDKKRVVGILASVPCTHFTVASQHLWKNYDEKLKTAASIKLVLKTFEIINWFNPEFWTIENPPGRISKCIPELKKYRLLMFQPFEFGDPYTKRTVLYGNFNPFLIRNYVSPKYRIKQIRGTKSIQQYYKQRFPKMNRTERRGITPIGFSQAYFNANNFKFEKITQY